MGRQERMTEQEGERSGGKAADLIPGRWEGRKEALSCFTMNVRVS